MLRWAVIEAIQRVPRDCVIGSVKDAIIARRGKEAKNIAKVAAARQLLTLIFYGLRDGQIRCLSQSPGQLPALPGPDRPYEQFSLASGQARGRVSVCPAAVTDGAGALLIDPA